MKKSFTLIEITTAIVIIIVLSAAGWLLAAKFMKQGRDAKRYADANSIATALQGYYFNHKDYPDPSDKIEILDQSGTLIGYQGIVDDQVLWNWLDVTKLPLDPADKNIYYSYVKAINPWENTKWYEVWTIIEDYRKKENGEKIYEWKYKTPYIISSNTISVCEKWDKMTYPTKISVLNYNTNEYARKKNLPDGKVYLDLLNLKWACQGEVVANIIWLTGRTIPQPEVQSCPDWYFFNGEYCDDKCNAWVVRGIEYKDITYNYTSMAIWETGAFIWNPSKNLINWIRTYYAEVKCNEWKWQILKERYVDTTKPKTIVINDYTYMTWDINTWAETVWVADTTKFSVWEEVFIITSQYTWVGQYEFNKIKSIAGSYFTFKNGVKYKYLKDYTQIVSVPNYTNFEISTWLTIVPIAWNGHMWWVVTFRASWNVTNYWSINAVGYGYRWWSRKSCAWCKICWWIRWCDIGIRVHWYRWESYMWWLNTIRDRKSVV